jgi:hypothetical protein
MTLPTESGACATVLSVGKPEGCEFVGDRFAALDFLALNPPREDMRYCPDCYQWACFRALFALANGHLGVCTACGKWRVDSYSRTVEA